MGQTVVSELQTLFAALAYSTVGTALLVQHCWYSTLEESLEIFPGTSV